jgi:hypothetical protein
MDTTREQLCEQLWSSLSRQRVMLVRAPPMSGKTSLCHIFGRYLARTLNPSVLVRISLLAFGPLTGFEPEMCAAWFHTGFTGSAVDCRSGARGHLSWNDLWTGVAPVPTILLVDEAQMAYGVPGLPLWTTAKLLQQKVENCYCVLFGAYGGGQKVPSDLSTPVLLADDAVWSISNLRFRHDEREAIFMQLAAEDDARYVYPLPERMCSFYVLPFMLS